MKKRLLYLILPVMTLVLESLPYGVVCHFASGPDETYRETFSYFDLTPFGYAYFAPLITAVITCIVLAILMIYCVTGKAQFAVVARNILCVCAIFSLCPLAFGMGFSVVGALITAALIAELLLLHFSIKALASAE